MIIQEIQESDFLNLDFLGNLLTETTKSIIPQDIKKFLASRSNREKLKADFGERAFLMPKEMKFPVINFKTGGYDCRLIYAARIRAKQFNYSEIAAKAEALYNSQGCTKKINVKLHEHKDTYDLIELMNLLEIQFKPKKG